MTPAALDDVGRMAALLAARDGVDPARVCVRGSSLGGYLAIHAAATEAAIAGAIAICPASEEGLRRGLRDGALEMRADVEALDAWLGEHDLREAAAELAPKPLILLHARATSASPTPGRRSCASGRASRAGCSSCRAATTARSSTTPSCRRRRCAGSAGARSLRAGWQPSRADASGGSGRAVSTGPGPASTGGRSPRPGRPVTADRVVDRLRDRLGDLAEAGVDPGRAGDGVVDLVDHAADAAAAALGGRGSGVAGGAGRLAGDRRVRPGPIPGGACRRRRCRASGAGSAAGRRRGAGAAGAGTCRCGGCRGSAGRHVGWSVAGGGGVERQRGRDLGAARGD